MEGKSFDKGRIVYFEPNDLCSSIYNAENKSSIDGIQWDPDDLNINVDLKVIIPRRSDCGQINYEEIVTHDYTNFLGGNTVRKNNDKVLDNGTYLTTDYTDVSYSLIVDSKECETTKENLGINSIDISFDAHFFPIVNMKFTDVRASALLEPSEIEFASKYDSMESSKSFFAALFQFPYPRFLLSVKGMYGSKITFILAVHDFKSGLNQTTGDFNVDISFIGYMYGLYTDIPMTYIMAAPFYNSTYWNNKVNDGTFVYRKDGETQGKMYNFLEFYEKYTQVSSNVDYSSIDTDKVKKVRNIQLQKDALKNNNDSIEKCINNLIEGIKTQKNYQVYTGDKYVLIFSSNSKLQRPYGELSLLSGSCTTYSSFDNTFTDSEFFKKDILVQKDDITLELIHNPSFIQSTDDLFEITKETTHGFLSGSTITLKLNHDIDKIKDKPDYKKIHSDSKLEKQINTSKLFDFDVNYYCLYSINTDEINLTNYIRNTVTSLEKQKEEALKDASGEISKKYTDALGFTPTLNNIFRMLYAHLDTFINYFNGNVLKNISQNRNNRTKDKVGLNNENSDIKFQDKPSTGELFVYPFPSYYVKKNDNSSLKVPEYPGNAVEENIRNGLREEIDCVETIIDSIEDFQSQFSKIDEALQNGMEKGTLYFKTNFPQDIDLISPLYTLYTENPFNYLKDYQYNEDGGKYSARLLYIFLSLAIIDKLNGTELTDDYWKWLIELFKKSNMKFDDITLSILNNLKTSMSADDSNYEININNILNKISPLPLLKKYNDNNYVYNKYYLNPKEEYRNIIFIKDFFNTKDVHTVENYNSGQTLNICGYNGLLKNRSNYEINKYRKKLLNGIGKSKSLVCITDSYKKNENINFLLKYTDKYVNHNYVIINKGITDVINEYTDSNSIIQEYCFPFCKGYNSLNSLREFLFYNKGKEVTNKICGTNNYAKAYLLIASIVGTNGISFENVSRAITNTSISLLRKIDLLYVGAYIYRLRQTEDIFKDTDPSQCKDTTGNPIIKETPKNFKYEIISKNGLLFNNSNIEENEFFKNKIKNRDEVCDILVEYFTNWVNNTFSSKIEMIENGVPNSEYTIKGKSKLYGYERNSEVELLLRKLYFEYENVFSLKPKSVISCLTYSNLDYEIISNIDVLNCLKNISSVMKDEINKDNNQTDKKESDNKYKSHKNDVYYTLKRLYDKWLCTYTEDTFKLHKPEEDELLKKQRFENSNTGTSLKSTEFNNLIFVDQYFNDLSESYMVDLKTIYDLFVRFKSGTLSSSFFEVMAEIAQKNKLLLLSMPVYNNFYSLDAIKNIFTPNIEYSSNNTSNIGNTYVFLYTGEPSKFSDFSEYDYITDYIDIADDLDLGPFEINNTSNVLCNYKVPAFGVTYGKGTQSYFKSVQVNMDNPKITEQSLRNLLMISDAGKNGDTNNPVSVGQNIYSIYANRSYTCTIEMMGCMNIIPLMYFNLCNVPMFRGTYMIINVKHSITPGNMLTTFTGVRISRYSMPEVTSPFASQDILEKITSKNNVTYGGDSNEHGLFDDIARTITGGDGKINRAFDDDKFLESLQGEYEITYPTDIPTGEYDRTQYEIRDGYAIRKGYKITCNKHLEDKYHVFTNIFKEISDKNCTVNGKHFKIKEDTNHKPLICVYDKRTVKDTTGSDSGKLSWHSYGIAVDLNHTDNKTSVGEDWEMNVFIPTGQWDSLKYKEDNEYCIRSWNHPVVKIFNKYNFGWGLYNTQYDFMHFSYWADTCSYKITNYTKNNITFNGLTVNKDIVNGLLKGY